ncbi:MAG: SymE family type I addiction module toxin [Limisphaerales bacterium]
MQINPLDEIEVHTAVRTLKIEAAGDFWKGLIKPKIRLTGRWLEQAGFKPGSRVQVKCVSPGVIELRSPDTMDANAVMQLPSEENPVLMD